MLCPYCKEEIADGAIKCKHCQSMLTAAGAVSAGGAQTAQYKSPKEWIAHRFYAGKIGTGLLQLLLPVIGIITIVAGGSGKNDVALLGIGIICIIAWGIWTLVDLIVICISKFKDKNGYIITNKPGIPAGVGMAAAASPLCKHAQNWNPRNLRWLLFSTDGRLTRAQYSITMAALLVFCYIVMLLLGFVASLIFEETTDWTTYQTIRGAIQILGGLGIFMLGIAPTIKRLHDRDKSEKWIWLFLAPVIVIVLLHMVCLALVPNIIVSSNEIIDYYDAYNANATVLARLYLGNFTWLIIIGLCAWIIVYLCCLPGTAGCNKWCEQKSGFTFKSLAALYQRKKRANK